MDGCPCCLPRGQSIFALPEHELMIKAFVKIGLEIQARPWQLWPSDQQITYRVSAYLLTVMFWSLQIAHAEEVSLYFSKGNVTLLIRYQMIFWGYLIRAIRNPNNACAPTPRVWIKAPCFKFWTAISISTGLLLFGAASIEIKDIEYQRVGFHFPRPR